MVLKQRAHETTPLEVSGKEKVGHIHGILVIMLNVDFI